MTHVRDAEAQADMKEQREDEVIRQNRAVGDSKKLRDTHLFALRFFLFRRQLFVFGKRPLEDGD